MMTQRARFLPKLFTRPRLYASGLPGGDPKPTRLIQCKARASQGMAWAEHRRYAIRIGASTSIHEVGNAADPVKIEQRRKCRRYRKRRRKIPNLRRLGNDRAPARLAEGRQ